MNATDAYFFWFKQGFWFSNIVSSSLFFFQLIEVVSTFGYKRQRGLISAREKAIYPDLLIKIKKFKHVRKINIENSIYS